MDAKDFRDELLETFAYRAVDAKQQQENMQTRQKQTIAYLDGYIAAYMDAYRTILRYRID